MQLAVVPLWVVCVLLGLQLQALVEIEMFLNRVMPLGMMAQALFRRPFRAGDSGRA